MRRLILDLQDVLNVHRFQTKPYHQDHNVDPSGVISSCIIGPIVHYQCTGVQMHRFWTTSGEWALSSALRLLCSRLLDQIGGWSLGGECVWKMEDVHLEGVELGYGMLPVLNSTLIYSTFGVDPVTHFHSCRDFEYEVISSVLVPFSKPLPRIANPKTRHHVIRAYVLLLAVMQRRSH